MQSLPVVAAFDFDGTMTYRDSFIDFLKDSTSLTRLAIGLAKLAPAMAWARMTSPHYYQDCKELLLTEFFQGMSQADMQAKAADFSMRILPTLLRPEAMKRLRWHQQQGHRCFLVSASLDIYLRPWASHVGFENVIASQLAYDAADRVTGKLLGRNCRGPEKTRRLLDAVGPKSTFTLYAYGDSSGDKELLALADFPYYRQYPN